VHAMITYGGVKV